MTFKPMLAVNAELDKIKFPVLATPKIDGIRCIVKDGRCTSRNMKDIPNRYVRETILMLLGNETIFGHPVMFDGEIIVGTTFQNTSSSVMSFEGEPDFTYRIFDFVIDNEFKMPYDMRMSMLAQWFEGMSRTSYFDCLFPVLVHNNESLLTYKGNWIDLGYEGAMLRSRNGPYKFGRSTVKEGYLLKIKDFEDSEAEIIGFEEQLHNANEAKKDALGHTERSTHKENMIGKNTLGSLKVRDLKTKLEFSVGSGLSDDDREKIWNNQYSYLGRIISYKFQPHGQKDLPRFPVFKGFRDPGDMS